jgi:hypothetical protein
MANHLANARYIIGLLAVVSLTAISVHGAEMSCEAVSHYSPATWSVTALPAQLSDAGYSDNDPYDLTDIQTLARDPQTGNLTCTAMIHVAGNRWSFTHWLAPYEGRVTFQVKTLVPPVRLPPNMPSPPPVTLTTDTPATLEFLPEVTRGRQCRRRPRTGPGGWSWEALTLVGSTSDPTRRSSVLRSVLNALRGQVCCKSPLLALTSAPISDLTRRLPFLLRFPLRQISP